VLVVSDDQSEFHSGHLQQGAIRSSAFTGSKYSRCVPVAVVEDDDRAVNVITGGVVERLFKGVYGFLSIRSALIENMQACFCQVLAPLLLPL
jgi:hypothetical protein